LIDANSEEQNQSGRRMAVDADATVVRLGQNAATGRNSSAAKFGNFLMPFRYIGMAAGHWRVRARVLSVNICLHEILHVLPAGMRRACGCSAMATRCGNPERELLIPLDRRVC
jgi:hypothetical protein